MIKLLVIYESIKLNMLSSIVKLIASRISKLQRKYNNHLRKIQSYQYVQHQSLHSRSILYELNIRFYDGYELLNSSVNSTSYPSSSSKYFF